jgi:RimJ/RimL family protein N-acetyltransferase
MQSQLLDIDTALLTPRTVVRRFREGDGIAFFELLQENHTRLGDHFPKLIREINDQYKGEFYIRQKMAAWLLQEEFSFGIWEHESAKLVGMARLFHLNWTIPLAEVSYFIDQNFSGRGLMTESLLASIKFAFQQLHLQKLVLRTAMDNYASQRLARKVGFRREGDLREECRRPGGELVDIMLFGLTRTEFEKV